MSETNGHLPTDDQLNGTEEEYRGSRPGVNADDLIMTAGGGGNPLHKVIREHNVFPMDAQESLGKANISERSAAGQVRQMIKYNALCEWRLDIREVHWHKNAISRSINGWGTQWLVALVRSASGSFMGRRNRFGNQGGGGFDKSPSFDKPDSFTTSS